MLSYIKPLLHIKVGLYQIMHCRWRHFIYDFIKAKESNICYWF